LRYAQLSLGTKCQMIKNGRLLVTPTIAEEDNLLKTTMHPPRVVLWIKIMIKKYVNDPELS